MYKGWLGGLSIKELASRAWREANQDNIFGAAAELAFYFLLALFPMLIFLTSLVGFMPGVQENILAAMAKVAPHEAMEMVRRTLADVVENRSGGLLSFGILGTIWAASTGVDALIGSLNRAYEAQEGRSYIKQRAVALMLLLMLSVLVVGGTILIMFGDKLIAVVADNMGLSGSVQAAWRLVDYALGLGLILFGLALIYYFAPNVKQRWRWITPGAVFALLGLILTSLLFSLYLRYAPSYSATYGSLGAVIVLMLWLYLMGLVLMFGGEINSEVAIAEGTPIVEKEPPGEREAA